MTSLSLFRKREDGFHVRHGGRLLYCGTLEEQFEDVPPDMEYHVDTEGHTYDFGYGMNWSRIIEDTHGEIQENTLINHAMDKKDDSCPVQESFGIPCSALFAPVLQGDSLPLVNLCPLLIFSQFIAAVTGSKTALM